MNGQTDKPKTIDECWRVPNNNNVCRFVALRPKSIAMVMVGRPVHLTRLLPGQV